MKKIIYLAATIAIVFTAWNIRAAQDEKTNNQIEKYQEDGHTYLSLSSKTDVDDLFPVPKIFLKPFAF